jgi:hypothetical protein
LDAPGLTACGGGDEDQWDGEFHGARLGFLLIAASIPPLTAALLPPHPRQDSAIFAGLLSAIPACYLSYQGTTDNFSIYMILGGLWFLVLGSKPFVLGLLSGLMHLARADGFLWLFLSFAAVFIENRDWRLEVGRVFKRPLISNLWLYSTFQSPISILQSLFSSLQWILPVLIGYLVVMGPWMFRNLIVFGTPLCRVGEGAVVDWL